MAFFFLNMFNTVTACQLMTWFVLNNLALGISKEEKCLQVAWIMFTEGFQSKIILEGTVGEADKRKTKEKENQSC